jgi:hypothetical protein
MMAALMRISPGMYHFIEIIIQTINTFETERLDLVLIFLKYLLFYCLLVSSIGVGFVKA